MQIIEKSIGKLKPYENNPRKNEDAVEYVANSIREFGWQVPIVIDKDNTIVAGHTRYLAAIELGIDKIPCVVAENLSEAQIKAFRLADNKVSEMAGWDWNALEIELDGLDIDMEQFGFNELHFDDDTLDELFTDAPEKEKSEGAEHVITCPHCGKMIEVDNHFKVTKAE